MSSRIFVRADDRLYKFNSTHYPIQKVICKMSESPTVISAKRFEIYSIREDATLVEACQMMTKGYKFLGDRQQRGIPFRNNYPDRPATGTA